MRPDLSHIYVTPNIIRKSKSIIKYNKKAKLDTMLYQQLQAMSMSNFKAIMFLLSKAEIFLYKIKNKGKNGQSISKERPKLKSFLTLKNIKSIHRMISKNFLDDPEAYPGKFRTYPIMTGVNTNYPTSTYIKSLMQKYCKKSNKLLSISEMDPISAAAIISTDFVNIHPFPDFNGRMSRILLNSALHYHEYPFPISIRSDSKAKRKYLYSLRKTGNLQYKYISVLLANEIIDQIERLNKTLKIYGKKQIKEDWDYFKEYETLDGTIFS
ncbi:hypothetical protein KHM19_23290 [Leptospira borgpetersenii]|uniref:Fic/DOC family protein n=1 Tax=Leptospira borgpetersenii serovar Javanica str. UI 09931 TaxID=1049767 RepID=A0AAV3J8T0_LEPBO|nr:cell filamentation protein Fic [Leptospira borgpetersenii serovar Ceylonica]EKQ91635.1 Fic/DOC family protein [Leptospira borgpetersenii str. UI 09149]EMN56268.1 Fic/DOC family protein [Leptospira borgpetersenii serovar Javanica str. MK146]EPG56852.1 Fic/DOC family protein [Leptospira borgpetersenii serovar Javanica str. UI 09931]QVK46880.1 Fic family protein [Leptospira borgpetersenii]